MYYAGTMKSCSKLCVLLVLAISASSLHAQSASLSKEVDAAYPASYTLYVDLHQNPELSSHEVQTAAKLTERLRALGYEVSERIGGTGIVAILKSETKAEAENGGRGPVIMLRTELDALPVEEKTGLPYASKVRTKDAAGQDVPVMHACGHDLHMATLLGTATIMANSKNTWHGTLMLVGQPAEETISGAKAMLDNGFSTRFPRPDAGVALHVMNGPAAGMIALVPGIYDTNSDSVRITIYGKGGHGSAPDKTIDPIVIAARTVLALQTIVSREVKPGEMAVVTVGYIHAGTKNNIIPDSAELGLTVRTFNADIRKQILAAITRITNAEAEAAGVTKLPLIEHPGWTDSVYNNPALEERLRAPLEAALGKQNVVITGPVTGSEDYSYFVNSGIPSFYFTLGGADPQKYAASMASGENLPTNHSPLFAPDVEPALRTGIISEVTVLRNLLQGSPEDLRKSIAVASEPK